MKRQNIFELYKPLRNYLRKLNLEESLYVIWAYTQYLQYKVKFPTNIEVAPEILQKSPPQKGIYPWELELLSREVVLNSQQDGRAKCSLRNREHFQRAINKLKTFEDEVPKGYVNEENILVDLQRRVHRQIPWQKHNIKSHLIRYFKLFSFPAMNDIVQESIGLTVYELYLTGFGLFSKYLNHTGIKLPVNLELEEIKKTTIERFLKCFSKEFFEIKSLLENEQEFNDKYAYSFSSLTAFPLIRMDYDGKPSLVCPLPTLLLWRFTGGLYYELFDKKGFDNVFGKSFENLTGEIIKKSHSNKNIVFMPESEYCPSKKERKDTVDWVVHDNHAALFIECKTKRMPIPAKTELTDTMPIQTEIKKLAEIIEQVYKTIDHYRKNYYPDLPFSQNRKIFPLIVTLEKWYIFDEKLRNKLNLLVVDRLEKKKIPLTCLDEMPYSLCAFEEFEEVIQIIQIAGIKDFMSDKVFDKEKVRWDFNTYIESKYPGEISNLEYPFEDDYRNLFQAFV